MEIKQISQNYRTGVIRLENVSSPSLQPGGVLVQTAYSLISAGTERTKVQEGRMSYLEKARARPDQVKKVLQMARQQGLVSTYQKVINRLDSLTPLGYSISGTVVHVGSAVSEIVESQRVACAGVGYANHAEVNFVPKNLVVPVPPQVSMAHAAFAALGAIALQGVRQAEMQLGETAGVIGLGLVGQLLVQLLRAAGVRVAGIDLSDDRCKLAMTLGAAAAVRPDDVGLRAMFRRMTSGAGVDCVFIAASGDSDGPVELAAQIARDRGRVIALGRTPLDLPWKVYYEKELDVRFSRSYGPGRYDPNYEERGIDYPIGYVRWTEQRNMAAFLDLVATGAVQLEPMASAIYPFNEAEQVYEEIANGKDPGLAVLFSYPQRAEARPFLPTTELLKPHSAKAASHRAIRLGVIGAGNYASSMLLPHLAKRQDVSLVEVATATSLSAANAARKFNFQRMSTDYQELLRASDIDAVVVATRHSSHARIAAEALRAHKAVFLEKPLALDLAGVDEIRRAIIESENKQLMVGFNRRFSPFLKETAKFFKGSNGPLMFHYRVYAGQLDSGSWYLDPSEGSRFVGEAGHFFDLFSFLTDSRPTWAIAKSLRPASTATSDMENVTVTVAYENGSVASLLYLSQGGSKVPKEFLEVFGSGRTVQLDNFRSVTFFEGDARKKLKALAPNKGHREELEVFLSAVKSGAEMPISMDSLLDTTLLTLTAAESLRTGQPVQLADTWQKIS
jgi:predicted dehydrogenase/threonine dehydrogenase-like Zn-dependent dehydrogenase